MTEMITKIEEISDHKIKNKYGWDIRFEGYKITTTKQEIFIIINQDSNCCENFGYMVSEDDVSQFVGTEIKGIYEVSSENDYNPRVVKILADDHVDICDTTFINVDTSKGTLQFAIYNEHNGYYAHDIKILSNQFNYETSI